MTRIINQYRLGACEKAAENGDSGGCFRRPFHLTPIREPPSQLQPRQHPNQIVQFPSIPTLALYALMNGKGIHRLLILRSSSQHREYPQS
jgi:hypothetical protein